MAPVVMIAEVVWPRQLGNGQRPWIFCRPVQAQPRCARDARSRRARLRDHACGLRRSSQHFMISPRRGWGGADDAEGAVAGGGRWSLAAMAVGAGGEGVGP